MIKHIVAGGCSQTQDGLGGIPPNALTSGGCSFIAHNDYVSAEPQSWVSFVAQKLAVESLVNTAASSHGNQLITNSIIEVLTRFPYDPKTTLVLFNVTWPTRLDVPCDFDHPDRSKFIPWSKDLIPYTYLATDSKPAKHCYKHIGSEQVEQMNYLALRNLFNFLENNQFNYKFILAKNFSDYPALSSIINSRQQLIKLEQDNVGIVEFVTARGLNRDIIHPTVAGHEVISNTVLNSLSP